MYVLSKYFRKLLSKLVKKYNQDIDRESAYEMLNDKIKKAEDTVIYRDLDDEMVFVSGLTESGMKIEEKDRTEHHKKMFELSASRQNLSRGHISQNNFDFCTIWT